MQPSISMYEASIPVFKQLLTALAAIMDKAQTSKPDETLLQASLYPDMFNFTRQVQIACDFAKGVSARLAGVELPVFEDNEQSMNELQARIQKTLQFIATLSSEQMKGCENKEILLRPGTPKEMKLTGLNYLLHYGLPQFFFHVTTAYGILRSQGIEIGKKDYIGSF